jgi:hypothetical protein
MQLTRYTRLTISGGYQILSSENGASSDDQSADPIVGGPASLVGIPQVEAASQRRSVDGSSYYFSLVLNHRLNRFYQDSLRISHEFQPGLLSDRTETTGVYYNSTWAISRRFSLSTSLFFQYVQEYGQDNDSSSLSLPDYQRYGFAIFSGYQLTKKLNVGLSYQFIKETSEEGGDSGFRDYTQNRFGLRFGYQF